MSAGGSKRAVAEIRFGEDRAGVAKVGGRSIHQYWSMLSPHFRDVFLAPQRRSDDGGVSWTWREPAEKLPLTVAELAGVRSRLERAKESFEENPVNPLMSEASSQEIIDQLTVRVAALADGLAGKPDAALAEFVCRSETGAMVHSWGLSAAARIFFPDSLESGIGGVVLFGGKGSAGNEVVIENAKGLRVARTVTDEAGEFSFGKLAPGRYRVRVIAGPGEFSKKGVSVAVERGEMSRIELRSTSDSEAAGGEGAEGAAGGGATDTAAPVATKKRRTLAWVATAAVLFLVGGGFWVWRVYFRSSSDDTKATQRISTLTPEDYSSAKPAARATASSQPGGVSGAGSGAVADGPGEASSSAAPREKTTAISMPAFSTSPGSTPSSVSKIGTRVELSGVNSPGVGAGLASSFSSAGSSGAMASAGTNFSPTENLTTSSDLPAGAGQPAEDARNGNRQAGRVATAAPSSEARAAGGPAPEALTGHVSAGLGGAMPGSPAGSEAEKKPGLGKMDGSASDRAKSPSGKTSAPPVSDRGKNGVSPEAAGTASSADGTGSPGAGGVAGAAQGPEAAVQVVEKPVNKSDSPAAGGVDQPAESPETNSNQETSGAGQSATAEKPKQEKAPKARAQPRASGAGAGEGSTSAGTGATSTASPTGAALAGNATGNESSADDKDQSSASSNAAAAESTRATSPVASPAKPTSPTPERAGLSSGLAQGRPLPAGMQVMGAVRLGGWSLRVGRDMIVPTLPVREGEKDFTEIMRQKLLEEQKARLPASLQRPSLQWGFAFKFAAGAKTQTLRWSVERVPGVTQLAKDNRAELGWDVAALPRGIVMTLLNADGTEVARVEFAADGRATVALRPELRAALWLGAMYAEADDTRGGSASRLAWQVVRGPLSSSAWSFDSRWLDGAGCRLEVVLNGAAPAGTRIAFVDQVSGWQLSTELE